MHAGRLLPDDEGVQVNAGRRLVFVSRGKEELSRGRASRVRGGLGVLMLFTLASCFDFDGYEKATVSFDGGTGGQTGTGGSGGAQPLPCDQSCAGCCVGDTCIQWLYQTSLLCGANGEECDSCGTDECVWGKCQAASGGSGGDCLDANEPNDIVDAAEKMPDMSDCDSSYAAFGLVDGVQDRDWFWYQGTDELGCTVSPSASIENPGLMMCYFTGCPASISCPDGEVYWPGEIGYEEYSGCCVQSPGEVWVPTECSGIDDNAPILILVASAGADACLSYAVTYRYGN